MVDTVEDALEDDWEILRRDPSEAAFPTTINMAEAIERICKAIVDYSIHTDPTPEAKKREIESKNLFPVFTVIPFFETETKKRLWKVSIIYEGLGLNHRTNPHSCCEQAVEELFEMVRESFKDQADELHGKAEALEQQAYSTRGRERNLRRISSGMGKYNMSQPNLPLKVDPPNEE